MFFSCFSNAQQWFDVGLKYGLNVSQLANKNIFNDKQINQELNFSQNFGAKFGFNLSENHEVTFDYMHNTAIYEYSFFSIDPKESIFIETTSNEYQLFYRHNKNGSYFEIGPSIVKLNSVVTNRYDSKGNSMGSSEDASSKFETSYPALNMGFGGYILGTENIGLTIGFRFGYSLKDVLTTDGGRGSSTPYPTQQVNGSTISYENYKETRPFTAMVTTELNFDFAYIARAACRRAKLVLF